MAHHYVRTNRRFSKDEILKWLGDYKPKPIHNNQPHEIVESALHQCPKSDKCVMDCYHKKPHKYEEKYCNDLAGKCGVECVHELISDCTFFDEDFLIE